MRSDKYDGGAGGGNGTRNTQAYDRWEETQMVFASRDKEKEELRRRKNGKKITESIWKCASIRTPTGRRKKM